MPIVSRRVSIPAFHALFDRWAELLDGYEQVAGTGDSRDVAYWHYENSLTGLLATAAWQTAGAGLAQFSTGRDYGKPEDSGSGSGDAWLLVGKVWYAVEAKLCWSRSSVDGCLREAQAQLESLGRDVSVGSGLAICYCAPAVAKRSKPDGSVKKLAEEYEPRMSEFAFVVGYECVGSPPESENYLYPGVVILGRQTVWSEPSRVPVQRGAKRVSRIFVPAETAVDWQPLLSQPDRHWVPGYSARALAYCWQEAQEFPPSVRRVLGNANAGGFKDLTLLLALPEYRVRLPPTSRAPSQTDLLVLARAGESLVSIAVEGKVAEPFGQTVSEWRSGSPSEGRTERLRFLCRELRLAESDVAPIGYQLLHRTAAALIAARQFNARHAVMLVHSFSHEDMGFEDYARFVSLLGGKPKLDRVTSVGERNGTHLHLAWVRGEEQYLRV